MSSVPVGPCATSQLRSHASLAPKWYLYASLPRRKSKVRAPCSDRQTITRHEQRSGRTARDEPAAVPRVAGPEAVLVRLAAAQKVEGPGTVLRSPDDNAP